MGVNEKMTALADAIRTKANITGKLSITGMTEAVENITVGGGGGDVTPGSVVINKNKVHVLAGYVENQTLTIPSGSVKREGIYIKTKEGYVMGGEFELPLTEPRVNKNIFTVEEGWVDDYYEVEVPESEVIEDGVHITIRPGYIAETLEFEKGR